ncbi:MAG TPA: DUF1707 domain-containing protein [Streptosporangiaceae bacterium]|nr:DUF1707 domain-containing protein [Streptosporangiaceae bacterium]
MAARPDLRIGDAEREARAAELREHYAHGRLSLAEFNERLDAVFAAATQEQLDQVTADLPQVRMPSTPLPVTASGAIPPGGGGPGGGSRGSSRPGARGALSMLSGLAAAFIVILTAWLLVRPPGAMHFWGIPWAGRAGLLLAVLAIVRGLIRRIFGLGRRR